MKHKYIYVQRELQALFRLKYDVVEKDFNDYDHCISLPSLPYVLGVDSLEMFQSNKQNGYCLILKHINQKQVIRTQSYA